MRVLMVCDRYPPEARSVGHLFEDLACALAERGHEISVLTQMPSGMAPDCKSVPTEEQTRGVHVSRLPIPCGQPRQLWLRTLSQLGLSLRVLLRLLAGPRPDVLLVYSPPLLLAASCAMYCWTRGVPLVLNLHDLYPRTAVELGVLRNPFLVWGARLLEDLVYGLTAAFVVPAPGSRDYLLRAKGIPADRVTLVYNWVDVDRADPGSRDNAFRRAHGLGQSFVVSYAGVIGLAQDLGTILDCARIMAADAGVQFVFIGEGPALDRWRKAAEGLPNVRFLAPIEREAYLEALRASDACLIPLSPELRSPAIPAKLQSIMSVERPVIAVLRADTDAARVIEEGRCGLRVDPGDAEELRRAIEALRREPELGRRLGRAGREFASRHFTLPHAAGEVESILQAVARR